MSETHETADAIIARAKALAASDGYEDYCPYAVGYLLSAYRELYSDYAAMRRRALQAEDALQEIAERDAVEP